uniref:Uncharacterized protein MANES_12G012600 n=1 Tax=Rhizophora mucronata TaxID=61149 RepID=A0A2P2KL85_RHIMU
MEKALWTPAMGFPSWIPILCFLFSNIRLTLQRNCTLDQSFLLKLLIYLSERSGWEFIQLITCSQEA